MINYLQYARLKELVFHNARNHFSSNDRTDMQTAYRIGKIAAFQEVYSWLLTMELENESKQDG